MALVGSQRSRRDTFPQPSKAASNDGPRVLKERRVLVRKRRKVITYLYSLWHHLHRKAKLVDILHCFSKFKKQCRKCSGGWSCPCKMKKDLQCQEGGWYPPNPHDFLWPSVHLIWVAGGQSLHPCLLSQHAHLLLPKLSNGTLSALWWAEDPNKQ